MRQHIGNGHVRLESDVDFVEKRQYKTDLIPGKGGLFWGGVSLGWGGDFIQIKTVLGPEKQESYLICFMLESKSINADHQKQGGERNYLS